MSSFIQAQASNITAPRARDQPKTSPAPGDRDKTGSNKNPAGGRSAYGVNAPPNLTRGGRGGHEIGRTSPGCTASVRFAPTIFFPRASTKTNAAGDPSGRIYHRAAHILVHCEQYYRIHTHTAQDTAKPGTF